MLLKIKDHLKYQQLIINIHNNYLNLNQEELIVCYYLLIYYLALTKKLIEKVKKEWDEAITKKENELEEEKKDQLSVILGSLEKDRKKMDGSGSDEVKKEESSNSAVLINETFNNSVGSPFKIIE